MQMRPEIQIASMIKAMTDVVIPALGSSNKLASEQAQLVVGMLSLMSSQLPMQFRFDRDELGRLIDTANTIGAQSSDDPATQSARDALAAQCAEAQTVLAGCQTDPARLESSVKAMRASLCALIDAFGTDSVDPARESVEKAVFAMSRDQLLRDRALMKPQGWEADPAALPDIGSLV